ncbi:hypothetical protein ID866_3222 [Astraeus odoratus]|nr:hypothetical protein ID866_3222 [Astraeus odoratus]
MVFHYDASDPLAVVTTPPANETPEQRAAREEREAEARRISDQIDEELRAHKAVLKDQEQMVKVLLLGQSESGECDVHPSMMPPALLTTPSVATDRQVDHPKELVFLNSPPFIVTWFAHRSSPADFRMQFAHEKWAQERASWRVVIQLNLVRSVNTILDVIERYQADGDSAVSLADKHQVLVLRLRPLRRVEEDLKRLLGTSDQTEETSPSTRTISPRTSSEFFVRSREWRSFLQASRDSTSSQSRPTRHESISGDDITKILAQCAADIRELWEDHAVREVLKQDGKSLEHDSASFFLDSSDRISAHDYQPTDDDVLRARLRTLDIQEHELYINRDGKPKTWKIYDRQAWLPYFDQVNAIIFLAPISCFNERLAEDPRVNRLEDSFILWKAICSSGLIKSTTLIVFLNKIDLLEKKISEGVMVKRFLPSYADRPNEAKAVIKYLRAKFKDTVRHYSPEPRTCHIYATSVIDARDTARILISVRDGIMTEHLKKANLV